MPGEYPKTDLSFDEVPLEDLRDPVLNGPGVGVIEDSVAAYRTMAGQIERTAERVQSALSTTQAASEGEAADASRRFIESVAAQGDYGAAQAAMAARALGDQAEYHARVRTSMEALKRFRHDPAVPATSYAADKNQPAAVEAANLYQDNTNWNLDQAFQPFDPPPDATPNMVDPTSGTSGPGGGALSPVGMHSAGVLGAGSGQSAMSAGVGDGVAPSGVTGLSGPGGASGGGSASGPAMPFGPGAPVAGPPLPRWHRRPVETASPDRPRGGGQQEARRAPIFPGSARPPGRAGVCARAAGPGSADRSRGSAAAVAWPPEAPASRWGRTAHSASPTPPVPRAAAAGRREPRGATAPPRRAEQVRAARWATS
jgi:hypothetical protein